MGITETYMAPGDFTVPMAIETPHLMKSVIPGGYLVVTPQHLGDPRGFTDASLLAAARYTGIVLDTRWTNGTLTLRGAGLEWLMGDLVGHGWPCPTVNYAATAIATVISLIAGGGIIPPVFSIGATITGASYTGSHTSTETTKEVLMQVMAPGIHYKISPNGEINCESTSGNTVYKATPEVVLVRDGWGSDALWIGAPVDQLRSTQSLREWLSVALPNIYGLSNSAVTRTDTTTGLTTTKVFGAEMKITEIRTRWAQIGDAASVGDKVYVFDPGSGFVGDAVDIITFRGRYLQPVPHRIHEAAWPIIEGMGVYYRPGKSTVTTSDWIDLTATTVNEPARTASTYLRALDLSAADEC